MKKLWNSIGWLFGFVIGYVSSVTGIGKEALLRYQKKKIGSCQKCNGAGCDHCLWTGLNLSEEDKIVALKSFSTPTRRKI